jgi:hypothetical protein
MKKAMDERAAEEKREHEELAKRLEDEEVLVQRLPW